MDKLFFSFSEDVNSESSLIITMFGKFTDFLYSIVKWCGIPFVALIAFLHFIH